ncbi:MAG: ferrous iron transport protein B [Planctomycetes bacterium]|nr:ferrous iron transport protein B [Planctomycetota bacterium]
MPTTTERPAITVALLGNPNTGKSTLFSALAGVRQRVGNYPGVTVEKKLAQAEFGGRHFTFVDLPGTYSLAPRSPDEIVAVDVLLGHGEGLPAPDVVVCILDAGNLQRNLYLVSQVMALECPLVLVLNMMDVASARGVDVDVARLRERLGVPVIPMQAHRRVGVEDLKRALIDVLRSEPPRFESPFPAPFLQEVSQLQEQWRDRTGALPAAFLVERLLLDTSGYMARARSVKQDGYVLQQLREARARLKSAGHPVPAVETASRYGWVDRILDGVIVHARPSRMTLTDWIDRAVTHPLAGMVIFLALMGLVFQSIFSWAMPLTDGIEHYVGIVGDWVARVVPDGVWQSLLSDGVVAGVGAVLAFLPLIAVLFFFIAVLEDCGYMARGAYLMDNLMSRVGLCGKSFIPLLSCFGCAVPGIMAARVIADRRDRLATILVAPLMSCSARLPVYMLLIGAFIPNRRWLGGWLGLQGVTMFALYFLGIVAAICGAMVFKRTLFKGETPPFVMELPDYRFPSLRVVATRVVEQCWTFIRSAGTLILAVSVILWAAAYFPRPAQLETDVRRQFQAELQTLDARVVALESRRLANDERLRQQADLEQQRVALEARIASRVAGAYMEQSLLGRLGKFIAPLVQPLGWDWRIGCAVIASFPAREVVIGALGVIFEVSEGPREAHATLEEKLAAVTWPGTNRPLFTIPVALSLMVFCSLCAQCAATLFVIRQETGSGWWSLFTFAYMTTLAYLGALITYQVGSWIAGPS